MLNCGACQSASYCSSECQKSHWKVHKPVCKQIKAAKSQPEQAAAAASSITPVPPTSSLPQGQPLFMPISNEEVKEVFLPVSLVKGDTWYLKPSPGKGLGLFAVKDLAPGDLIMVDHSLFSLPWSTAFGSALTGLYKTEQQQFLEHKVNQLPSEAQQIFWGLHDCNGPPDKLSDGKSTKSKLIGIAKNAKPLGYETQNYGMFPLLARFNHSCRPNVHCAYDPDKKVATAYVTAPVKKDEELFTSYYDLCLIRKERQKFLQDVFSFTCTCQTCSLQGKALEESEKRRGAMRDLDKDILNYFQKSKLKPGMLKVELKLRALEQEGISDSAYIAKTCYDAFQGALIAKRIKDAKAWAKRAHQARVIGNGADSHYAKKMEALAQDPTKHKLWTS
eukprot:gb/GEZN01009048.1/.p1 GENE.gb/GEZN01009048.1/~~gb/GEZN01009048.1/.p1  ORF type:complete len:413 (-),score=58.62 gb/GEZN01009048.1/:127-1296(-)